MRKSLLLASAMLLVATPMALADPVSDEVNFLAWSVDTAGSIALNALPTDALGSQVGDSLRLVGEARAIGTTLTNHGVGVALSAMDQVGDVALPATQGTVAAGQAVVSTAEQAPATAGTLAVNAIGQGEAAAQLGQGLAAYQVATGQALAAHQGCDVGSVHDAGMLVPFPGTWQGAMAICATTESALPAL